MDQTAKFLSELAELYQSQYVSSHDLALLKRRHRQKDPENFLRTESRSALLRLQLPKYFSLKKKLSLLTRRAQKNQQFIKAQQKKTKNFQVEGHPLDKSQVSAVLACEDAALILAPAGSGKTATLLAKIDYLTTRLKIPAKDILVIAFTNKVVAELRDRIKSQAVEIRTFHSLGNKIIKSHYKDHQLITDAKTSAFFRAEIRRQCSTSSTFAERYRTYLKNHAVREEAKATLDQSPKTAEDALAALFISSLGLLKSERLSLADLNRRLSDLTSPTSRQDAGEFFALFAPVARAYQTYLKDHRLYDFADMINLATDHIKKLPATSFSYQYVLVDEAQDLSTSKCQLLAALLDKCDYAKLFAVGDDWQSIYRFAGSNLSILAQFEQIFARSTYRSFIEYTYRFGQPTAKISNRFIQKNPHQSKKRVRPALKRHTPIKVRLNPTSPHPADPSFAGFHSADLHNANLHSADLHNADLPPDYLTLERELESLHHRYGKKLSTKRLQIISRYNHDIFRLIPPGAKSYRNILDFQTTPSGADLVWKVPHTKETVNLSFCSMHKAKGITRDIVFVINLNQGHSGMPATRAENTIASAILARPDSFPLAEERRLFYVAITRAREQTILISDFERVSPFVFEVSPKLSGTDARVCPRCHRGVLVQRRHKKSGQIFYACSNRSGKCHYIE